MRVEDKDIKTEVFQGDVLSPSLTSFSIIMGFDSLLRRLLIQTARKLLIDTTDDEAFIKKLNRRSHHKTSGDQNPETYTGLNFLLDVKKAMKITSPTRNCRGI